MRDDDLRAELDRLRAENEQLRAAVDATEHGRVVAELDEARAMLLTAFRDSPLLMTLGDLATGRAIDVNDAFCRASGWTRDEVIGSTPLALGWLTEQDRAQLLRDLRESEPGAGVEVTVRNRHGERLVCRYWGEVIRTARGDRLFSVAQDITAQKRAEAALRETTARLSAVIEHSPIGIVLSAVADGTILDVNDAALRLYGYGREEAIGRTVDELQTYADRAQRDAMVRRLLETGRVDQLPVAFRRRSGEIGVLELSARLVEIGGERRILTMLVDVTARRRAEDEKLALEGQFQQAQKMESVGRLAGGVAHDFNNMLSVILGYTELAAQALDPAHPALGALDQIAAAAKRSVELTRQLLAFARRQTIAPRPLDVNATIEGMLKLLRRLIGENVHVVFRPGADLWPLLADPAQIDQLLANLCVNARDAITEVGTVTIETRNVSVDERSRADHAGAAVGDYVCITVRDDGCGMDAATQAHLFEPFFTTKAVGKGTGLGLATVYGVVQQNGGFIEVASSPGAGSAFSLYLPRLASAYEAAADDAVAPSRGGHETILVVEDEPAILDLAAAILRPSGYTVLTARAPSEALRIAAEVGSGIDLLLTDVIMPEMNGRELELRLLATLPGLRCLFMSGYPADALSDRAAPEVARRLLPKPFAARELLAKVREALDRA